MKPRTTLILFMILVIVGAFYYFYQYLGGESRKKANEEAKKLLVFDKQKIQQLQLTKESGNIVLTKIDNQWQITKPVRYNAEQSQIETIFSTLQNARTESVVLDSTTNLRAFGLSPAQVVIVLQDSAGKCDSIAVGSKNTTGAFTFARINNQPKVLLVSASLSSLSEKKLFDLRDKTILEFGKENVRKIGLTVGSQVIDLEKIGNNWEMLMPMKTRADNDEVDKILNKLNSEKVKDFLDETPVALENYGLAKPALVVDLVLAENNAQKRLFIGSKNGENYYAKDESRRPVFNVGKELIDVLTTDLFKLRNKKVMQFDRYTINQIKLNYADSTVVVKKDTVNTWIVIEPDSSKTKSWKISSMLGALVRLGAQEFVNERVSNLQPYGLSKPAFVVTLTDSLKSEAEVLYIGSEPNKESSYVTNKNKQIVYRVKNSDLQDIKVKLNDLIEK